MAGRRRGGAGRAGGYFRREEIDAQGHCRKTAGFYTVLQSERLLSVRQWEEIQELLLG